MVSSRFIMADRA